MTAEVPREKPDFQQKLHEVPHKPGVYLMRDRLNRVIYVGKARDLRKRLASYFTPSRKRMADLKTRALIQSIWDFDFHTVRNEPESLLLEGKLIKEFRPRYNISFRDDKRFLLVKVHLDEEWPRFQLARVRKEDGARYFGPFAHAGALRTTLNWMNREFGLRTCRPLRPGENDYKHCNDDVIRNCAAPCVGKISRPDYLEKVEAACSFLEGHSRETTRAMEEEMQKAAQELDFERAAELRDMLESLKQTLKPTRQFRRGRGVPRTGEGIKPLEDVADLKEALRLDAPPLVMECFDISNISTTHCVASMVRFKDGVPDNANYRRYRIKTVEGQDDFASMAEVVRRRYSRILLEARERYSEETEGSQESPGETMRRLALRAREEEAAESRGESSGLRDVEEGPEGPEGPEGERKSDAVKAGNRRKPKTRFVRLPDLVIVDGGKGQLSSATKELQRLGLHDLPIIGLAKEREEVYRPGKSRPLLIPHDRGALKLLQRIRDEAHRFANGYHQLLMKRRIGESILDDCPGVSENRKKLLLKKFGSVARLRQASQEEMAQVQGISANLARDIANFLKTH